MLMKVFEIILSGPSKDIYWFVISTNFWLTKIHFLGKLAAISRVQLLFSSMLSFVLTVLAPLGVPTWSVGLAPWSVRWTLWSVGGTPWSPGDHQQAHMPHIPRISQFFDNLRH